ncbi:helix-turn-helix domain-containing protein [Streptomyces palmae]|uniref:helix-turn-helix domain-containing protein n=1 Tax=Streptomyces palmae TaxID=1701085 RepID=UPI001FD82498|nr:helix-turn-helix transcriptional regulator [Streptomyces palmae]
MGAAEETAEFAELLRKLKERSGLSYGALAKRLHMSASTLHRYCKGEAVPHDYAPVERLARVCKATPEELIEAHRRWILADAARGRTPKGAPAHQASAASAVSAAGVPTAGDAAAGTGSSQVAGVGSGTGAVPGAEAGTGTDSAPVAGVGSGTDSGAGAGTGTASGAGAASGTGRGAGGSEAHGVTPPRNPRRRMSRARVVLAAAGAMVVLGGAAFAVQAGSDDGADQRRSRDSARTAPTAGELGGAPTGKSRAPGRSASPSASASKSASPSASVHATATSDGKRSGTPGQTAGKTGRRDGPVPLTVATRPYDWDTPCSQHYLMDRPAAEVPPPPTEQDAPGWVNALNAVSAEEQRLQLTVQGTGKDTVVLQALHVRTVETSAPLAWNSYTMGVGCGGSVDSAAFDIDLDAGRPTAKPARGQRDFPYKVSESDPEVLFVTARASSHQVRWYLELEWSSGDRHGTLRIDDRGRPFRTSGEHGRPGYQFPNGDAAWSPRVEG